MPKPRATKKQLLIDETLKVISQYTMKLTLRQIFYRLVSKHITPNTTHAYKYLSKALVDGRMEGQVPFSAMEDRTRRPVTELAKYIGNEAYWELHQFMDYSISIGFDTEEYAALYIDALRESPDTFKMPRWWNQEQYVEVWLEKEALSALFEEVTDDKEVVLSTCRGYPSLSFLHEASKRLNKIRKPTTILYYGDYDPSGEDIYRNIKTYLKRFGLYLNYEKIAITQGQITKYEIPPMPAKTSDPRYWKFVEEHGDIAVELDAIDPTVLQDIIRGSIARYFDKDVYQDTKEEEKQRKEELRGLVEEALGEE